MLRVCPKCLAASNDDEFCPHDGVRLVEPEQLPPSRRPMVSDSGEPVPNVPTMPPPSASKIATSPLANTFPTSGSDPLIGQVVAGRYRVLRQLGEGGMGNVYGAVQEAIEKKVALKVLKTEYSSSPEMVVRFHREAVSACRIKHPNVVDVFDLGQLDDGRFFLAMELLEGRDLAQLLAASGPMAPQRAVNVALQICRALNAAHQSGIVHRDLKPENVFLHRTSDGDEIVKIVDFGIAHLLASEPDRARSVPTLERAADGSKKLTNVGMVFGTPEYMAPEQATGGRIDHRADIYAMGIILYKMLTGEAPFSATSFLEVLAKQVGEEPPRMTKVNPELDIPKELEAVVMRALAKKPDDRFASMARFARAIAFASRDLRSGRRSWRRTIFIAAPIVLLLGAAAGFLWRRQLAESAAQARADTIPTAPPPASHPAPAAVAVDTGQPPQTSVAPTEPAGTIPVAADPSASASPASSGLASASAASSAIAAPVAPVKIPRPTARPLPAKSEPAPSKATPKPASTSLPGLERCFETVEGERREVPCN